MRAVIVDPSSWTLGLGEWPDPTPGPDDLVVEVRAAGISRGDVLRNSGQYLVGNPPRPITQRFVGGGDFAGVVVHAPASSPWNIGDRVMGMGPAWAELALIDHRLAMRIPETYSFEEGAATPSSYLTAHDALCTNGRVQDGDVVLVHAAPSGVGFATLRIAHHLNAITFGTSRSADKLRQLEPLGLTHPIDVSATDFAAEVLDRTNGHGADVVIDLVGASVLPGNIEAAAVGCRLVQVGRLGGQHADIDLDELARKRISLIGVTFRTRTLNERIAVTESFVRQLDEPLRAGELRPRIDRTYTFDEAAEAQQVLGSDAHVGKIVLTPTGAQREGER